MEERGRKTKDIGDSSPVVCLTNPWLQSESPDVLYHLGLGTHSHDLVTLFGDVKFVCMGGTVSRMRHFAEFLATNLVLANGGIRTEITDLTGHAGRYSMFKIGPVLSISHGIGSPSLSILLHEILKLLHHAKCTDVTFFRIGTSGGIGLEPGTVVITETAVDELLNPYLEVNSLGRRLQRPCSFDAALVEELKGLGAKQTFKVVSGKTLSTSDFYEGQGRLDGAFCDFSREQKAKFLEQLSEAGVKNIEMESLLFGALLHRAGIKGAVVCVTLVDRLLEDQVLMQKGDYEDWQQRPQRLVADYIRRNTVKDTYLFENSPNRPSRHI